MFCINYFIYNELILIVNIWFHLNMISSPSMFYIRLYAFYVNYFLYNELILILNI
jgi:hypothetical protein